MSVYRSIDHLGRVVIPVNLRNKLNIKTFDQLEFTQSGNSIIIKKVNNNFDFETFIREYIIFRYSNYYKDIIISKDIINRVDNVLCEYFDSILEDIE